jgi:cellulose synthase/poly-beta-1,6-N-acetylglucosamine synthase-like glycosyltransferase/peptidoglycan/xylan/chitin deacetylase (PgdA/CDA1 family)
MIFFDIHKRRLWYVRIALLLVVSIIVLSLWHFTQANRDLSAVCNTCDSAYLTQDIPAKNVALTFDDGPDANTQQILDTLDKTHTPATFFLVGQNIVKNPGLIKEISQKGYTIGDHTFTHSKDVQSSEGRIAWELDSTNKLIEALTGHSAKLYRPPYLLGMDTTPTVRPILSNQPVWNWVGKHGYITVGRDIATLDWQADNSAQALAQVKAGLDRKEADPKGKNYHVILLHSKPATAQALPQILTLLKDRGYTVVPLTQLLGISPAEAMPSSKQTPQNANFLIHFVMIFSLFWKFLLGGVVFIILFTLIRPIIFIAIRHYIPERKEEDETDFPYHAQVPLSVSVLIPAYNEEENIQGTILSVMSNTRIPEEVLVLDDGSNDETSERANEIAELYPGTVRVITLSNGGKASALNVGAEIASGDLLVCVDSDTIFSDDCIERIVDRFRDPNVGAVAGKVVPALTSNIFEKIQYLEYLVGQNIDKEALSRIGAVNVVPGAIGAWRTDVVKELDGYSSDTLAEDQELTLAVLSLGYKVVYEPKAIAYTEVPTTFKSFFLQRLRWMYGTFQCVWKYRKFLFRRKNARLGFVALPVGFAVNVLFPIIVAVINIILVISLLLFLSTPSLLFVFLFTLFDASYAFLGIAKEEKPPFRYLLFIPFQRFIFILFYSGLTLLVMMKVLDGSPTKWNKVLRTGNAQKRFLGTVGQQT